MPSYRTGVAQQRGQEQEVNRQECLTRFRLMEALPNKGVPSKFPVLQPH